MEYLRGLLQVPGRKSIRNIAAALGDGATEQRLHHFISDSSWDWRPVRRELGRYVTAVQPPQAWVAQPMVIPKAGEHSVGVSRRFLPALGQAVNAQQAVGIWSASDEASSPVNWRLHLTNEWLADGRRRKRASIPDGMRPETLGDCAVEAYLETMTEWDLPVCPLVLDARALDVPVIVRRLRDARLPFLLRINNALPIVADDPALPGHGAHPLPAHQVIDAARDTRRPMIHWNPVTDPAPRTSLTASVGVRMPAPGGPDGWSARDGRLLLFGLGEIGRPWPMEVWLADPRSPRLARPRELWRLTRLVDRVDRDFADIANPVGIRDFAGRSFSGWHRHVTLASAAHALAVLADARGRRNQVS